MSICEFKNDNNIKVLKPRKELVLKPFKLEIPDCVKKVKRPDSPDPRNNTQDFNIIIQDNKLHRYTVKSRRRYTYPCMKKSMPISIPHRIIDQNLF